jgi:mannose-6-phosphate isomerase-like protein (cupin superfamily)
MSTDHHQHAPLELTQKSFTTPDETRNFPHGKVDILKFGEASTVSMGKPIAKTETCQVSHRGYILSGRMLVKMEDGTTKELGPHDVYLIPPGHDAWIVGNDPCVTIEFADMSHYAKP